VARSWSTRRRARARARARAPAPARARARAGAGAGVGAGDGRHQRGGAGSRRRSGGARPKDQARVPGRRRRQAQAQAQVQAKARTWRGSHGRTCSCPRGQPCSHARTAPEWSRACRAGRPCACSCAQRLSGLVHAEPAGHVPAARAQLALDCKALYMELLASQDHFERAQGACAACALMRARARLRGRCSGPGTAWALGPWCRQHGDMAQAMAAGSQSPCLCALSRRPRHEYEPGPHILAGRAHKHARAAHDLVQIARPLADAARTWPCSSSWPGTSTRGTSAFDRRTWSAPTQRFERTHASSTSPLARDSVVATSSHCALVPPEQTAVRPAGTRPRHATSGHVFGAAAGGGEGD
jgi:hypothetical protein